MAIGNVVEFTRSIVEGKQVPEVKVDLGGGDASTAPHFANPGDDSFPLPSDLTCSVADGGTGTAQVVGYQDPDSEPKAKAGEKRIYARSGPGVPSCEVWLHADGSVLVSNDAGSVTLSPSGNVLAKNATASFELTAAGVTVTNATGTYGATTHLHGSPMGPTQPPIPGT